MSTHCVVSLVARFMSGSQAESIARETTPEPGIDLHPSASEPQAITVAGYTGILYELEDIFALHWLVIGLKIGDDRVLSKFGEHLP